MAEERRSWSPWFQRRIDQRDENHGPVGFCWLDEPDEDLDDDSFDRRQKPQERFKPLYPVVGSQASIDALSEAENGVPQHIQPTQGDA